MAGHSVTVDPTDDHGSSAAAPSSKDIDPLQHDAAGPDAGRVDARPVDVGQVEVEAADLRIELEVEARRRERWIRDRLRSDATILGALAAAGDTDVSLRLVTGERLTGRPADVGTDVVGLHHHRGITWVAIDAICALDVPAPLPAAGPHSGRLTLVDVLCDLAAERADVVVDLEGGTAIHGELLAMGEVATISNGPGSSVAYVPVPAVVAVTRRAR